MKGRLFVCLLSLLALSAARSLAGSMPDTPAWRTAVKFMRGVNFGNDLEYAAGDPVANAAYSSTDFGLARSEGFDHIRLPVAWSLYAGPAPDFIISPDLFARADAMVANALNHGLGIILDMHHFDAFMTQPSANLNEFYALWRQVAAHYAAAPSTVLFELLNEPNGNATTAVMNTVYAEAIQEIRVTNPDRTIIVGPGNYDSAADLSQLTLPANDNNLIATIHCYDPYYFTHQGAEWAYPDTKTTGVLFPGPPPAPLQPDPSITHSWVLAWFAQYNTTPTSANPSSPAAFQPILLQAKNWADAHGRPVRVGEFGCYDKADPDSRIGFYRAIREKMDALGLGWTMWDWKAGFHYEANGAPEPPGMRQAMFPSINLIISPAGSITFPAAVGKTFVVERTDSLLPPASWQTVSTLTLSSPQFTFIDPDVGVGAGTSFYRVRWMK
jgi:endoglucanase